MRHVVWHNHLQQTRKLRTCSVLRASAATACVSIAPSAPGAGSAALHAAAAALLRSAKEMASKALLASCTRRAEMSTANGDHSGMT